MNATTHGLTSLKPYLSGEESAYQDFAANQRRGFDAQTPGELELLKTIVETNWRLGRIAGLEALLFGSDPDTDPHKLVRSLDTLSRHETRLRKLVTKSIEILVLSIQMRRKMQQQKDLAAAEKPNGFVLQNAVSSTGLRACDPPATYPEVSSTGLPACVPPATYPKASASHPVAQAA